MSTIGKKEAGVTPWEVIPANQHHGPYIVNAYGADVADLYTMSNPTAASVRNGGNSYPVPFTDADANAELIVKAVNSYDELGAEVEQAAVELEEAAKLLRGTMPGVASIYDKAAARARAALSRAKGEA